jgi:hypothetical protein
VHYLAHHRAEVDDKQLVTVNGFTYGEAEPSEQELQGPEYLLRRIRASVERRLGPARLQIWGTWGLDLEALSQALRGGCLPAPEIFTQARQDAQELYDLVCSIQCGALPCVKTTVLRTHRDMAAWTAKALCVSGWERAAWISPLADMLLLPEVVLPEKKLVRMYLEQLKRWIEGKG